MKMMQYERIDVSGGISVDKSSKSKESILCHYWYFKYIGFKFQSYPCNGCPYLSIMVYDLNDFMILNKKDVDYRCFVYDMNKENTEIKLLNNSQLDDKVILRIMDFGANKIPVEVIKEDIFERTYFTDIYSSVNGK